MKISTKIVSIVTSILIVSIGLLTVLSYFNIKNEEEIATGMEVYGCANITTMLLESEDVDKLISGDTSVLNKIQKAIGWTIIKKPMFSGAYVLSLDGTILAADEQMQRQGFKAGDTFYLDTAAVQKMKTDRQPVYTEIYEYGNMERMTGYAPVFKDHDTSKEVIAINAVDFDAKIISERVWDKMKINLIVGAILPFIAAAVAFMIVNPIIRPINLVTTQLNKIADGDLTVEALSIKSKDEIGKMVESLNKMLENLKQLIGMTKVSAENVGSAAKQISASTEEVAVGSSNQSRSAERLNDLFKELAVAVQSVAMSAEAAASISEDTAGIAREGGKVVKTSQGNMNRVNEQVTKLAEDSEKIGSITEVIDEISEQTNLLALNAAIEAARAGDQGRGFAVVADEVRKLAERSQDATKQISEIIRGMQTNTSSSVTAVRDAVDGSLQIEQSFDKILSMIEETSSKVSEIAAASEEQSAQSSEVQASVESIAAAIEESAAASEETASSAQKLSKLSEDLNTAAAAFTLK